ncbi:hypothetical protein ACFXKX_38960 [Streptomyces scopuliridis]|uniref:hypothetical protein n=1 Tax=Streptomyces scopuliridis TaxID=452529 RepID=UPI0036CA8B76
MTTWYTSLRSSSADPAPVVSPARPPGAPSFEPGTIPVPENTPAPDTFPLLIGAQVEAYALVVRRQTCTAGRRHPEVRP